MRGASIPRQPGYRLAAAAILLVLAAVALWNARAYPVSGGYDAEAHLEYAQMLIDEGRIPGPERRSEYYTPPGFYALAGGATWVGERLGLAEPRKLAQGMNALLVVATGVLVLLLARLLWPRRPLLHLLALGFFSFLPVVAKTAAMFHPEPLDLFLTAAALYVAAWMIVRRRFSSAAAALLGSALGAGQLVRAFSLWTFAAVVLAFLVVITAAAVPRRDALRALALTLVVTIAIAGPWYLRQARRYANPIFDRPTLQKPIWERRPVSFYADPGLPELFTHPYRPAYTNRAAPTTYSELWGDWFGAYAWEAPAPPSAGTKRQLAAQHALGLVPTGLAVAGWVGLLGASLRRRPLADTPALLLVALLPGLGLLGYAYFVVGYPTPDGDVLKASYMLTTAPAWALCFGFAAERAVRRGRLGVALAALLALGVVVDLRFLVYGSPLRGLL